MLKKNIIVLFLILFSFSFVSCGSHGGDNNEAFSAIVNISANPNVVDTGDRTQLVVKISEVHQNGILLKIRFPKSLSYVADSSYIIASSSSDKKTKVTPEEKGKKYEYTYLVYFLNPKQFGDKNKGKLYFELKALKAEKNVAVEVDPDVNDPAIPDDKEFSIVDPDFSADAVTYVTIK